MEGIIGGIFASLFFGIIVGYVFDIFFIVLIFITASIFAFFGDLLVLEQPFGGSASLSVAHGCRKLIRYLVNDLMRHSRVNIENFQNNTANIDLSNLINFSPETGKKVVELKKYLFKNS